VRKLAGVTWTEYEDYFQGTDQAVGIWLKEIAELGEPITLAQLRNRWPWFRPPQSYCFLKATVEGSQRRVTSLAQRD
jgi:predicted transcriptional regulator